ncbi:sensor histidine kinase [Paenibacillus oryzae]|uniref:sensor histidine kinase n=1 Tax=Paenibacillus oryzae TaxID=1844972 RepID=UPI0009EE8BFF|nr:HAMP domain-containing sensor histidine kinase [Paenibacillus oryzae]
MTGHKDNTPGPDRRQDSSRSTTGNERGFTGNSGSLQIGGRGLAEDLSSLQRGQRRIVSLLRRSTLRRQLLVRSLLLMSILFLLVGIFQYLFMQNFLYRNKAEGLQAQISALPPIWLQATGIESNRDKITEGMEMPPVLLPPGVLIHYIDKAGSPHPLRGTSEDRAVTFTAEEYHLIRTRLEAWEMEPHYIIKEVDGGSSLVVFRLAGRPGSSDHTLIQASADLAPLTQQLMTQLGIYGVLTVLALGAGLLLNVPLLRRTLMPLSNVVAAAEVTDAGNLSKRVPESQGQEEIDRLSVAFNGMLARLDQAFAAERDMTEQMRRFIADASHELRTPLTSISGFIEVLQRGAAASPVQLDKALESMNQEASRLHQLVEDLLQLVKLDQAPQLVLSKLMLNELLEEMEQQLAILAKDRELKLKLQNNVRVSGDSGKLKQVVLNLVQNAVQHTSSNGSITVSLKAEEEFAILEVADNGTGIEETHLPHLFERFYRGEASRSRRKGGAGLGLAISKTIINAHQGDITVWSKPGQGTIFQITLPLYEDSNS